MRSGRANESKWLQAVEIERTDWPGAAMMTFSNAREQFGLRACLKSPGVPFSRQRPSGEARRGACPHGPCDRGGNEARGPLLSCALQAAGLLAAAVVGSALRSPLQGFSRPPCLGCDTSASPAEPLVFFRHALRFKMWSHVRIGKRNRQFLPEPEVISVRGPHGSCSITCRCFSEATSLRWLVA